MVLDEFLTLCGFSAKEKEDHRLRVEKTFAKVGIDEADVRRAIGRMNKYFSLEIEGIRQILGCHVLSLLDLVLAREEGKRKVIYADWPIPVVPLTAIAATSPDVYMGSPGQVLNVNLGQIFGKLVSITQAGEEAGITAGQAHCPLYQTHLGAIAKGIIPVPDLEVATGYMCEPPGAAAQLIEALYDVPVIYVDGCVDGAWGEWPNLNHRQVEFFGSEITKSLNEVERIVGIRVSDEFKRQAIVDTAKMLYGMFGMLELIARSDPQPLSQVDATLGMWMVNSPFSHEIIERTIGAIDSVQKEVSRRVEAGIGIGEKGAPRVFLSILVSVDPTVLRAVEDAGLNIAVTFAGKQPSLTKFKNPYKEFGGKVACGLHRVGATASSWGAIELMKELQREVSLDGMIIAYSTSCKVYGMSALMAKKAVAEEFGIPVIVLEGEYYDTRNYSAEQMRTRLETFAHLLRERKAAGIS